MKYKPNAPERDQNLGLLSDEELEQLPSDWVQFARLAVFSNGPVFFLYDKNVDARVPRYILPFHPEQWAKVVAMSPGDVYCHWMMDIEDAARLADQELKGGGDAAQDY